jgi:DAACS family dicarboxylate/amino acid:cation (Na+ or H+) symporter
MPRHTRILLALLAGGIAGIAVNLTAGSHPVVAKLVSWGTEPIGRMWLSALIMVVIPLIVSTLSTGVAGLGSFRRLGRIGLLTLGMFLVLTVISSVLVLVLVNLIRPGDGLDPAVKTQLLAAYQGAAREAMGLSQGSFGIDLLVRIIPRNPVQAAASGDMIGVIFFSLMLGVGITAVPAEKAKPLHQVLDSLGHVTTAIIDVVMSVAPVGVFCLVFSVTARFGLGLLGSLLAYVLTVIGGLLLMQTAGYSAVLVLLSRRNPLTFFRRIRLIMVTAFSTSSSNATLPTTIRVTHEELGVPKEIAGFVLPLGATMNMNGTALFEGATVLFLAQVFGVKLGLQQQMIVIVMSVLTAIGTAGIPGGSIPLLMMVLAMVGVPPEGIAIVLGIDRILDMCRTVLNVTGDVVTSTVVARFEPAGRVAQEPSATS